MGRLDSIVIVFGVAAHHTKNIMNKEEYLNLRYSILNKELFNNLLPEIPIILNTLPDGIGGYAHAKIYPGTMPHQYYDVYIEILNDPFYSIRELEIILKHEMIHILQIVLHLPLNHDSFFIFMSELCGITYPVSF